MVAFTLFCLLTQASPNVTITTDGATLGEIVKDLSAQSGLPLGVSAKLKNEIVVVQAKNVPPRELMDRIAEADGAEWTASGGGYELGRSKDLEKAQAAEEAACRVEAFKEVFDKEVSSHLTEKVPHDASEYMAWSVAQKLGPEVLATLPRGVRVIWVENPNGLQRRLGFSPNSMIQTYIEQCRRSSENARAAQAETAVRMEVSATANLLSGCNLQVRLRDGQGTVVATGFLELPPYGPDKIEPPAADTGHGDEKPLELSATAESIRKLARDQMGGHIGTQPPEFDEVVLHPEKYDPLSLFPSEVARVIAKRSGRSLVAVMPDFAMLTGIFFGTGKLYESEARKWLDRICVLDESKAGWMTLRPRLPVDARALRANRETMGKFYRDARTRDTSLVDLAAYVAAQPRRYTETISFFYGFFCQPELVRMYDPDGLGALRVYGALTPEQRTGLGRGAMISLVQMSPAARAELADWVYNGQFAGGYNGSNTPEPTDVFPNGLTMPCMLTAITNSSAEVIPLYNGHEDLDGFPLPAVALGYELATHALGTSQIKDPINGYWMGQGLGLQIRLSAPRYQLDTTLHEHRINRKGKPLTFNDLPEDFRKLAEDSKRQAMEQREAAPAPPVIAKP